MPVSLPPGSLCTLRRAAGEGKVRFLSPSSVPRTLLMSAQSDVHARRHSHDGESVADALSSARGSLRKSASFEVANASRATSSLIVSLEGLYDDREHLETLSRADLLHSSQQSRIRAPSHLGRPTDGPRTSFQSVDTPLTHQKAHLDWGEPLLNIAYTLPIPGPSCLSSVLPFTAPLSDVAAMS